MVIDGHRLTQEQFVREFGQLVDDGTIRLAPGDRIKLVTCYGAEGEHSTAAALARATGHEVTGATDRVWTHSDGRMEAPDGQWRTFHPDGTETSTPEVHDGQSQFQHRDGLAHATGDPPNSYRDPDGALHFKGDRPHTFRDAAHPYRLHHEKDAPGTYRTGTKFRLHSEQTGRAVPDPLRSGHPAGPRPQAEPRQTYRPADESADLQGARQRVEDADTPQAQRAARTELTRAAARQVLTERYDIRTPDIMAGQTPHTHRGAGELAVAGFDRAGHRLVVLETGSGGRYTLLDGSPAHRGSAEYLGDVLQTDTRLHAYLDEHPELTDELHRALQRGDITVEHHRIEVDRHGDIRLAKLPTDGLDLSRLSDRLPAPSGAPDPARADRLTDTAERIAPTLDRTGSPVSVTRPEPDTIEIASGEGQYRVELGGHTDRPFEVTLDDHGIPRIRLNGELTDRLDGPGLRNLLGRAMGHADGLVRGEVEARPGVRDALTHDPQPAGRPRLSQHDHARLGEFDALARLRDHTGGAERASLDVDLRRFIDEHGLREGMPGEPARGRLVDRELSEVGRRTLDELRGVAEAGDPAVATVRDHVTHDPVDGMRTRPVAVRGRDVFKVFPKGWRAEGRAGFSYELKSGEPAGDKVAEFRRTAIDRHFDLVLDHDADFTDPATRDALHQVLHDQIAVQHERPPESSHRARDAVFNALPPAAADGAFFAVADALHNPAMAVKSHITSGVEVLTGEYLRNNRMLTVAERAHDKMLADRLGAPQRAMDGWSDRLNDSRAKLADLAGDAIGDRAVAGHNEFAETDRPSDPIPAEIVNETRERATAAMDQVQRELADKPVEHLRAVRTPGRVRAPGSPGTGARRLIIRHGHNIWVEARTGHTAEPGKVEITYDRDRATLRIPPDLHGDPVALHEAVHTALGEVAARQHTLGSREMSGLARFTRDSATDGVTAAASVVPGDHAASGLGEAIGASGGTRAIFDAVKNHFFGRVEAKVTADRTEFAERNHPGLSSAERGGVAAEVRGSSRDGRAVTEAIHDRITGRSHQPHQPEPGPRTGGELGAAHRAVEQVNESRSETGGHWERVGDSRHSTVQSYRAQKNALLHTRMRIKLGEPQGDGPVEVRRSTLRKWHGLEITVREGADPQAIHQAVSHIAENVLDRRFHGSQSYWKYLERAALRGGVQLGGTGVIFAATHSVPATILGGVAAGGHLLRGTFEYGHDIHLANTSLHRTLSGYDPDKVTPASLRADGAAHQQSLESLELQLDRAEAQLAVHRPAEVAQYNAEHGPHYLPDPELLPALGTDLTGHTDLPHNATVTAVDGSPHTFRVSFQPKLGRPAEFSFDVGTGRAGGPPVDWHRVDSDVTHSVLVDPTRPPGELSGPLHDWVADRIRAEVSGPGATQGTGSRLLGVARDGTGQVLASGAAVVMDVATHGAHGMTRLGTDLIQQGAYAGSGTAGSAASAMADAHGGTRSAIAQLRADQLTARHFGDPTEPQLDVLQKQVDARIDRTWQAHDRYQRLHRIAATLPVEQRPELLRGAAPAGQHGPVMWGHDDPTAPGPGVGHNNGSGTGFDHILSGIELHGSPAGHPVPDGTGTADHPAGPVRSPEPAGHTTAADPVRLGQQVERELGRTLYAEPVARHAAGAALHRLVDTLVTLNEDFEGADGVRGVDRDDIVRILFSDDFRNAGQVTGAATLADIHEHGNLRMTMTAFYNGVLESHHELDLKHSVTRALEAPDWQERLTRAGLDVEALRPVRDRILASAEPNLLDTATLVGETGHNQLAVAEHRLSQDARTERDVLDHYFHLRTRQEYAENGLGLHDAEYAALRDNDRLTLRFQHSEEIAVEDLPRGDDGQLDTRALADRPDVRAVHVEYQRDPGGGYVTDTAGHRVPERVWVEVVDGQRVVNPRVHDLPPGTHGPELPVGWVDGTARYGMDESHDWYQEVAADRGMPVVSGISGTVARLMSAFDWMRVPEVAPEEFLHSLLGWMLPAGDHSLYELLRGAQMAHPDMFGEPGRGFTGVADMVHRIPGLEHERFDQVIDAADALPGEPSVPEVPLGHAEVLRADDGLLDSNALRRFLDRLPGVPGLSGHPSVPALADALRHDGPLDAPGGPERAALHRFAADALGRDPADLRDLEPVGGPGGAKGASGAPVFFVRNEAGARIGVVKVFPKMDEFAREVASIDRLGREDFEDLHVPEVRGIGVARAQDATAGVLVSAVADGRPLDDHLMAVRDSQGAAREVARAEAQDAFRATGRALAEMHNRPAGSGGPVADWFAEREGTARIGRMIDRWAHDPAFQQQFGFDGRALVERFSALGEQVRADAGPAALVHGDAHPGNFFHDPVTGKVTIIDLEGMHASMDAEGRPVGAAALDAGVFGHVLSAFAHNFDVGPVVPELRAAFEDGYQSVAGHPIPEHALTYYRAGGLALALNGTREVIMGESHPDGVRLDSYPQRAREQLGELHDLLGLDRPRSLVDRWAGLRPTGPEHATDGRPVPTDPARTEVTPGAGQHGPDVGPAEPGGNVGLTEPGGHSSAEILVRLRDEHAGDRFMLVRDAHGDWRLPSEPLAAGEHPQQAVSRWLSRAGLWDKHIETLEVTGERVYDTGDGTRTVVSADIAADPCNPAVHWVSRDELLWTAEQSEPAGGDITGSGTAHDRYTDALAHFAEDGTTHDADPGSGGAGPPDPSIDWRALPDIPEATDPQFVEAHGHAVRCAEEQVEYAEQLTGDGKYWFAKVYHNVTTNELRMIADGRYQEPLVKLRQVAAFHETYRTNLDRWLAGDHDAVEPNWHRAFTAAESMNGGSWFRPRSLEILKAVLPSLQAHIRFDLPRAIADVYEQHYAGQGRSLDEFSQDFFDMQPVFDVASSELAGEIKAEAWLTDPGRYDLAQQMGMRTIFNVPGERLRAWEKALTIVAGHDAGITDQRDMQEQLEAAGRRAHPLTSRSDFTVDGGRVRDYDWNSQPHRDLPGSPPDDLHTHRAAPGDEPAPQEHGSPAPAEHQAQARSVLAKIEASPLRSFADGALPHLLHDSDVQVVRDEHGLISGVLVSEGDITLVEPGTRHEVIDPETYTRRLMEHRAELWRAHRGERFTTVVDGHEVERQISKGKFLNRNTAVVMDRRTGQIAEAHNSIPLKADAVHPVLRARIDACRAEFGEQSVTPGDHAEINAVNQLLWEREARGLLVDPATVLREFAVDTMIVGDSPDRAIHQPCCPHCSAILQGARCYSGMIDHYYYEDAGRQVRIADFMDPAHLGSQGPRPRQPYWAIRPYDERGGGG